jgi:signal transduction histidine kinase
MQASHLAHPEERQSSADRIQQALAGGKMSLRRRRLLRRDGSEISIESSAFPMVFGGAPSAVLMGRDLTPEESATRDRRTAESATDQLRRSEGMTAMGQLVAGVAHEVRNPLFGMTATLDAMERRFGMQEGGEPFLRALRRELDRLNLLMRDLLEYGKPPALQLTTDSLGTVVALAVRSCTPIAELASVHVESAVGPDVGELPMDPGRLAQVFKNLIENAIQHSPPGSKVRIESTLGATEAAVSVLDSGPGFRNEDLPRIFEPFFSRRRGGTGLGLSIVQRIVEQHRGRIEVKNRREGGASVSVFLPVMP